MIISLQDAHSLSEHEIGSKALNLAKVSSAGFKVPNTLIIPSEGILSILNDHGLRHMIFELSRALLPGDSASDLLRMERELKSRFLSLKLSDALLREIAAVAREKISGFLVVRPSPFSPGLSDGDLKGRVSAWYCGLSEGEIQRAILKVLSDSFNLRAIARLLDLGVYPEDLSLALILQEAVVPRSSGVAVCYPAGRREILVRSTWGLMDGVPADKFRMSIDLSDLTESEINEKKTKILPTDHGLMEVSVESDLWLMPSLSREEAREIASISLDLSLIFGTPTVVEWMIGERSKSTFVIQAYRESGKPKMKTLERKVNDLMESKATVSVEAGGKVVTEPPVKMSREAEFPLLASRIYVRWPGHPDLVDGFLVTKEQVKEVGGCDRAILIFDKGLDEELLRNCRNGYLVVKSGEISVDELLRIRSEYPGLKTVLYADDPMSLLRGSSMFSGAIVPIEALSGIEGLGDLLRVLRKAFEWVCVDLQETMPSVDTICTLLKSGVHGFILSDDLALKQAQLILRAERRILLDLAMLKLRDGGSLADQSP